MFKRILSLTVIICFFLTTLGPLPKAHADTILNLPAPGTMVNLSPAYEPVMIKGLTVHKGNPFLFDFIVDVGQDKMSGEPLKREGEKLIKYFLASLAIPDKDVWVNLSPYEKNKMIPEALGQTDMGRDLLEQDYILKQITASLIYPEKQLGKTFWNKVYAKAQQMYGTTQIPVNTFNKVWIMADRAEVFEHNQTAFVVDSHLKVMLEEDYLALTKHQTTTSHSVASQIVREIILPELEKEVNTGKNFANLRQILNSLILANWYKNNLKQALLNQVYTNQSKVKGINLNDPTVKQQIYEQYLKAYKKGVFNYIKEDVTAQGNTIPRKYFSGGFDEAMAVINPRVTDDSAALANALPQESGRLVDLAALASTQKINPDAAMESENGIQMAIKLADQLREEANADALTIAAAALMNKGEVWSEAIRMAKSLDGKFMGNPAANTLKIVTVILMNRGINLGDSNWMINELDGAFKYNPAANTLKIAAAILMSRGIGLNEAIQMANDFAGKFGEEANADALIIVAAILISSEKGLNEAIQMANDLDGKFEHNPAANTLKIAAATLMSRGKSLDEAVQMANDLDGRFREYANANTLIIAAAILTDTAMTIMSGDSVLWRGTEVTVESVQPPASAGGRSSLTLKLASGGTASGIEFNEVKKIKATGNSRYQKIARKETERARVEALMGRQEDEAMTAKEEAKERILSGLTGSVLEHKLIAAKIVLDHPDEFNESERSDAEDIFIKMAQHTWMRGSQDQRIEALDYILSHQENVKFRPLLESVQMDILNRSSFPGARELLAGAILKHSGMDVFQPFIGPAKQVLIHTLENSTDIFGAYQAAGQILTYSQEPELQPYKQQAIMVIDDYLNQIKRKGWKSISNVWLWYLRDVILNNWHLWTISRDVDSKTWARQFVQNILINQKKGSPKKDPEAQIMASAFVFEHPEVFIDAAMAASRYVPLRKSSLIPYNTAMQLTLLPEEAGVNKILRNESGTVWVVSIKKDGWVLSASSKGQAPGVVLVQLKVGSQKIGSAFLQDEFFIRSLTTANMTAVLKALDVVFIDTESMGSRAVQFSRDIRQLPFLSLSGFIPRSAGNGRDVQLFTNGYELLSERHMAAINYELLSPSKKILTRREYKGSRNVFYRQVLHDMGIPDAAMNAENGWGATNDLAVIEEITNYFYTAKMIADKEKFESFLRGDETIHEAEANISRTSDLINSENGAKAYVLAAWLTAKYNLGFNSEGLSLIKNALLKGVKVNTFDLRTKTSAKLSLKQQGGLTNDLYVLQKKRKLETKLYSFNTTVENQQVNQKKIYKIQEQIRQLSEILYINNVMNTKVAKKVISIIAGALGISPDRITTNLHVDDDSIIESGIILALEDEYKFVIPDETAQELKTVEDFIRYTDENADVAMINTQKNGNTFISPKLVEILSPTEVDQINAFIQRRQQFLVGVARSTNPSGLMMGAIQERNRVVTGFLDGLNPQFEKHYGIEVVWNKRAVRVDIVKADAAMTALEISDSRKTLAEAGFTFDDVRKMADFFSGKLLQEEDNFPDNFIMVKVHQSVNEVEQYFERFGQYEHVWASKPYSSDVEKGIITTKFSSRYRGKGLGIYAQTVPVRSHDQYTLVTVDPDKIPEFFVELLRKYPKVFFKFSKKAGVVQNPEFIKEEQILWDSRLQAIGRYYPNAYRWLTRGNDKKIGVVLFKQIAKIVSGQQFDLKQIEDVNYNGDSKVTQNVIDPLGTQIRLTALSIGTEHSIGPGEGTSFGSDGGTRILFSGALLIDRNKLAQVIQEGLEKRELRDLLFDDKFEINIQYRNAAIAKLIREQDLTGLPFTEVLKKIAKLIGEVREVKRYYTSTVGERDDILGKNYSLSNKWELKVSPSEMIFDVSRGSNVSGQAFEAELKGSPWQRHINDKLGIFVLLGNNGEEVETFIVWQSNTDKAALALANNRVAPGGIDLNVSNGMQWKVSKDGNGVEMNIDPAMIERIKREGIDSLSPVIFKITPIASIWPLVGLQAPAQVERLASI